jgi:HK97 family phage portal protein
MDLISLGLDAARWSEKPDPRRRSLSYDTWGASGQGALGLIGPTNTTGVPVTQHSANTLSAYWNGICVISGDIAALDRHIYRRVGDNDRERATSLPAYALVHDTPSEDATGMMFWETLLSHAVGWGNGYAEIEFDRAMRPIALHTITPDLIEPKVEILRDRGGRTSTRVYYLYRGTQRLESWEVFHVPGLGFDGVRGYSPVYLARQSLGLAIAMERFGGSYFGNGTALGVALEHPGELGKEGLENLRADLEARHRGAEHAFRPLILEEGMKVSKPITVPPADSQFLESREFSIEEVARWLNLPPHKLKHKVNERPGGNFEASEIDYQVTTLLPWTTRVEQECDRKLISPKMRSVYYTEHNFAKRLKADTTTRMLAYKTLADIGAIDKDEIARRENLPKPKDTPAPAPPPAPAPAEPAPTPEPAPPARRLPAPEPLALAQRALLTAEVARYMRREAEQARRAADKGVDGLSKWLERWYGADEERLFARSLAPAVALCVVARGSRGDAEEIAGTFARQYQADSKAELRGLGATAVAAALKRWESTRAVECVDTLLAAIAAEEVEDAA